MHPDQWQEPPQWRMRPITRPGTPSWVAVMFSPRIRGLAALWATLMALTAGAVLLAGILLLMADAPGARPLGALLTASPFAAFGALWWRYHDDVVGPFGWRYRGVRLTGEALAMLEDIQGRFDYARRLVDQVPSGLDWREIEGNVGDLLWEAVEHGARVSALDAERNELRYASAGTPQAALRSALDDRRAEHWRSLEDIQREADGLAGDAGNAAAAARIALSRTGSVHALEIVAPTARGILARDAIKDARARLVMLADVWRELDETGLLEAERLDADAEADRDRQRRSQRE